MKRLKRWVTLSASLSALGGLLGVSYAQDAPHSMAVATELGVFPLGDLTLPMALVIVGGMAGKAVARLSSAVEALATWTPRMVVEHRYAARPVEEAPEP